MVFSMGKTNTSWEEKKGNTGMYPSSKVLYTNNILQEIGTKKTFCTSSSLGFHLPKGNNS
jgi:hypothetical protein